MQLAVINIPDEFKTLSIKIDMKAHKGGGSQDHTVIADGKDISDEVEVWQEED